MPPSYAQSGSQSELGQELDALENAQSCLFSGLGGSAGGGGGHWRTQQDCHRDPKQLVPGQAIRESLLSLPASPLEGSRESRQLGNNGYPQHLKEAYSHSRGDNFQVGRGRTVLWKSQFSSERNTFEWLYVLFVLGEKVFS